MTGNFYTGGDPLLDNLRRDAFEFFGGVGPPVYGESPILAPVAFDAQGRARAVSNYDGVDPREIRLHSPLSDLHQLARSKRPLAGRVSVMLHSAPMPDDALELRLSADGNPVLVDPPEAVAKIKGLRFLADASWARALGDKLARGEFSLSPLWLGAPPYPARFVVLAAGGGRGQFKVGA